MDHNIKSHFAEVFTLNFPHLRTDLAVGQFLLQEEDTCASLTWLWELQFLQGKDGRKNTPLLFLWFITHESNRKKRDNVQGGFFSVL